LRIFDITCDANIRAQQITVLEAYVAGYVQARRRRADTHTDVPDVVHAKPLASSGRESHHV
jgi:hypothetical protein